MSASRREGGHGAPSTCANLSRQGGRIDHVPSNQERAGVQLPTRRLLEAYDQHGIQGPDPELVAEAREKFVPKSKLRDIEHNFGKKVDFLLGRGMIHASLGAGLHKLHDYRNEAYHRDKLRTETLAPAVRIYFDMACTLLADFDNPGPLVKKMWSPAEFAEKHPGLTKYASLDDLWYTTDGMPKSVSERLLAEVALDVDTLRDDLVNHLRGRISEIEKELAFSQWSLGMFEGWKLTDMLRMAQMIADMDKGGPALSLEQMRGKKVSQHETAGSGFCR